MNLLNAVKDNSLITIAFILLLASCTDMPSGSNANAAFVNQVDSSIAIKNGSLPTTFDSTLTLFTDTSYKLKFHVFDTQNFNEEKSNSTVTFSHIKGYKAERIFQDSFYCMSPLIEFQDFNNDGVKDILFFYYTGGRSNPTYHLYLVDTINHKLTYVKGFENLPNPDLDSANNVISSSALYGTKVGFSFYRIDTNDKLINLGHSFETEFGDFTKYDKAIKQIIKQRRR